MQNDNPMTTVKPRIDAPGFYQYNSRPVSGTWLLIGKRLLPEHVKIVNFLLILSHVSTMLTDEINYKR